MRQAFFPIGRADEAGEASPIRKADDAATEETRADDVGECLQSHGYLPIENTVAVAY